MKDLIYESMDVGIKETGRETGELDQTVPWLEMGSKALRECSGDTELSTTTEWNQERRIVQTTGSGSALGGNLSWFFLTNHWSLLSFYFLHSVKWE